MVVVRITSRRRQILRLRKLLNELVEPERSLTDEFIAERRLAAKAEVDELIR